MDRQMEPMPVGIAPQNEYMKEASSRGISYIECNPASQVVLSPRLEQAVRRVGGCQTEEVLVLVRQIMYEVLQSRK